MKTVTVHPSVDLWNGSCVKGRAFLTPYIAADGDGKACVICPGGSYFWLDRINEGRAVAEWLQSNGISAFLLEYRTAGVAAFMTRFRLWHHVSRAQRSMQDLFMALDYIKKNSGKWHIDPSKVGVLGFSAGGHMALMAAEKNGREVLSSVGVMPVDDPVPAFVGVLYPVVSFVDECKHGRSCRGLIGDFHGHHKQLLRDLSAELNVHGSMPPVFIVSCDDDNVVDPRNSLLLRESLESCGVRHEYCRYGHGGHGFGVNESLTSHEAAAWKQSFLDFVKRL